MSDADKPLGLACNEWLGALPEADMSHRKALDDCDEETSYSAEAMEAERQRCYALGVADERERCAKICEAQEYAYWRASDDQDFTPQDCANAIRGA